MADSPLVNTDGVVECTILSNGKELPSSTVIVSADVYYRINGISKATVVLEDGYMPTGEFKLCDGNDLKPGSEITIKVGYGTSQNEVFKGVVVKMGISILKNGHSSTKIECRDKIFAMTCARKNANYVNKTDDAIVADICGKYGASIDSSMGGAAHKELLQYYCSDWDFIMARAEANGCWLINDMKGTKIKKVAAEGSAAITLTWGTDILEFNAFVDATNQIKKVEARSWDISQQNVVSGASGQQSVLKIGDIDNASLEKVLKVGNQLIQLNSQVDKTKLDTWAKAEQLKNELSRVRGFVTCTGTLKPALGGLVELKYLGKHFNGDALVSEIHHHMEPGMWTTKISFGMEKVWHVEKFEVEAPKCSGYNCGVSGLLTGVVIQIHGDPENMNRVKVKIPLMQNEDEGVWARLGGPYASAGFGCLFYPEVDDEVILGFFNDDPSSVVILGSLYSSKKAPPQTLEQNNNTKMLLTREKMSVEFNEEKKVITIKTPGNRTFILDDENKKIVLDDSKSSIVISDDGIKLSTPKDVVLDVKGKLDVDAKGGINLKTTGDLKGEGVNVEFNAKVGIKAKGSASAELSASGQTTVKGAMVMIN